MAIKCTVLFLLANAIRAVFAEDCDTESRTDWECLKEKGLPTANCMAEDIRKAGHNGNMVFYSMGAHKDKTMTDFAEKLNPRGYMFDTVLPVEWIRDVMVKFDAKYDAYLTKRLSMAMALAAKGDVIFVSLSRHSKVAPKGSGPQPSGIFQYPKHDSLYNVWRNIELPTLQMNPAVVAIYNVAEDENYANRYRDWTRAEGGNILPIDPNFNANGPLDRRSINISQYEKRQYDTDTLRTRVSACTPKSSSTAKKSTITPAPTLSCQLQEADPDLGINSAYCLCDKSITLSVLPASKDPSQSCAYSTVPTSTAAHVTPTTHTQVWTTNCHACTIVGGVADIPTCTTVGGGCVPTTAPRVAAWVSNISSIDIGNAADANHGLDLAREMFGKLKSLCSVASGCTGDSVTMDNVEAIIAEGEEPLTPAMSFKLAAFGGNMTVLDRMLAAGLSAWISAMNSPNLTLCEEVDYEATEDNTVSGCGTGPIPTKRLRRKIHSDTGTVLWERPGLAEEEAEARQLQQRCVGDNCIKQPLCHYKARMCNAPSGIFVTMTDEHGMPDSYILDIDVHLQVKSGDGFLCEEIISLLSDVAVLIAPELAGAEVMEGVELGAICGIMNNATAAAMQLAGLAGLPIIGTLR